MISFFGFLKPVKVVHARAHACVCVTMQFCKELIFILNQELKSKKVRSADRLCTLNIQSMSVGIQCDSVLSADLNRELQVFVRCNIRSKLWSDKVC